MNNFQQTFIKNFLVQCLYKPEISDSLLKMGVQPAKYKTSNFEDEAFKAVTFIRKYGFGGDQTKKTIFEEECKAMGVAEREKSFCSLF